MDFNLKQWKESEDEQQEQNCSKIPRKMFLDSPQNHQHQQHQGEHVVAALPLFLSPPETQSDKFTSHFSSVYSQEDHSSTPTAIPTSISRFSIGGRYCFSMAQWQELELQALIYRHIVAGSTVPPELLHLIKRSLLASSFSLHHYPPAALLQAGYWGKGAMDPEPGRCRRTDGKKWRCSRDIVAGHKYCERHIHRGRNRSRKPVEIPSSAASAGVSGSDAILESLSKPSATFSSGSGSGGALFSLSGSGVSSFDAFQRHSGPVELKSDKKTLFESTQHDSTTGDTKSNKVLMDFFDESTRVETNGNSSLTSLSMSTPGNPTSNFLRLSTGNGDEVGPRTGPGPRENLEHEHEREQISWTGGWGGNTVASMGGPLAEVLRSSSTSSPTSVLHHLPKCSAPDTSFVSA